MKKILNVVQIIFIIFNAYLYINNKIEHFNIQNTYNKIKDINNTLNIDILKEKYKNTDIVGYIKIDNILYEPLLQTTDNTYYLNHLIDNSENILGSTFVDYRTTLDSKQINIYSHSSKKYKLAFNILSNYLDLKYYTLHKNIELSYLGLKEIYEIFSVYVTDSLFEHLDIYSNDWKEHVNILNNNSIYESTADINLINKIVVLQTCLDGNNDGVYLIICGRRIE